MNIWDSEKVITTIKRILLTGGIDEWELWWSASCQPWSRANRDPRKSTDKRRRWPIHVANIVNALRDNDASPSVIYSENITHAKKAQEWKDGLNIIANAGYELYQADINSKFTGSCTDRPRWFVVFIKKAYDYKCFLPDIAKIIQNEPATTLGQVLPHRKVTYYYAASTHQTRSLDKTIKFPDCASTVGATTRNINPTIASAHAGTTSQTRYHPRAKTSRP